MIRDLTGYGGDGPDFRWQNGWRLACRIDTARTFAEAVS